MTNYVCQNKRAQNYRVLSASNAIVRRLRACAERCSCTHYLLILCKAAKERKIPLAHSSFTYVFVKGHSLSQATKKPLSKKRRYFNTLLYIVYLFPPLKCAFSVANHSYHSTQYIHINRDVNIPIYPQPQK